MKNKNDKYKNYPSLMIKQSIITQSRKTKTRAWGAKENNLARLVAGCT